MTVMFVPRSSIRGRVLPVLSSPAGYAALVDTLELSVPLPRRLTCVSPRNQRLKEDGVSIVPNSAWPGDTVTDHLVFALKYEGINLRVLKKTFLQTGPTGIVDYIQATPTGQYARRLWFLYEFLIDELLPLPDARSVNSVPALHRLCGDREEQCQGDQRYHRLLQIF